LITGMSIAAIAGFLAFRSNLEKILRFVPFAPLRSLIASFAQGLNFLQSGRSMGLALLYSAILWFVLALQFWLTLVGMNFELSVEAATLVMVGTALGSIVQVPGVGGGFQAGFVFCMATFFKIPKETALAAALVAWAFNYAPTLVATFFYMAAQGVRLRDLKAVIQGPQSESV
jgi:uncharacterized membrane protein YbhN (UPF0104 family)